MMFDIIDHKPQLNPLAHPIKLEGDFDHLLILIHGYTGIPRDFNELGKLLNDKYNFSIIIPRLPGHGTDSKDFRKTGRDDWLRSIYDLIINMEKDFDNIHLIGLSMGALIALLSSIHFNIKSLLLISPALYSKNKNIIFSHILKYVRPSIDYNQEIDSSIKNPDLIDLYENYNRYEYTAQLAELHKLMLECRRKIKKVDTKIKIIHSKKDELIPLKSAYKIYENVKSKDKDITIFDDSPHVINYGPEKERLFKEAVEFFD